MNSGLSFEVPFYYSEIFVSSSFKAVALIVMRYPANKVYTTYGRKDERKSPDNIPNQNWQHKMKTKPICPQSTTT